MSKPPINPEKTAAGIALDPQTLERVVPESRRPDGSIRKQIKIRPGYTPQEDVSRFRGTKQAQMDANALPKGHILGWAPPSSAAPKPMTKSAKKNAKRKEKRAEKTVQDNWEDEDEEDQGEGEGQGKETKDEPTATDEKEDPKPVSDAPAPTDGPPAAAAAPGTLAAKSAPQPKTESSSSTPTRSTPRPPRHAGGLAGRLAAELNKLNVSKP